jgi:Arylsulfotransferase (ASST)
MSVAKRNLHGVTIHDRERVYGGYTLFAPLYGKDVWLIDMDGRIVHRWPMEHIPGNYGKLLDNGNLLFAGKVIPSPLPDFGGNGGQIAEFDWDGNKVWEYLDPYHSHCFAPLDNGNVLIAQWREVPDGIARSVKGGQPGTERQGVMWGEAIQEIDRDGRVVWEWLTFEHLDPARDILCPLCPRDRWTNINALHILPDGNILASLRCIDTIAIIDRATGDITWRWGPGEIAHQHNPTLLDNGNILLFDNGAHRAYTTIDYSRVIEVNPKTGEVEWEYKENPVVDLNSFICSGAQRLPNGNTLICECTKGRIFEVTRAGETVWEYQVPFYFEHAIFGTNNMVFRAYRYTSDHAGLKDAALDPDAYAELNALMPRRFTTSHAAATAQGLGVTFEKGSFTKGGH